MPYSQSRWAAATNLSVLIITRNGWPIQAGAPFGVGFGDGLEPGEDGGGGGRGEGEGEGEGVDGLRLGLVDLRRPRRMGVMEGMRAVWVLAGHTRGVVRVGVEASKLIDQWMCGMTCWDRPILPSSELAALGALLVENPRRQGFAAMEAAPVRLPPVVSLFQLQSKAASFSQTRSLVFPTRHARNLPPTMRTSQCLFNSAVALHKVFINNAAALECPDRLRRLLLPIITVPSPSPFRSSPPRHLFSTHHVSQYKYSPRGTGTANASAPPDRTLRNDLIPFSWIHLREEDGSLSEPVRLSTVLENLNKDRQSVVLLATPKADNTSKRPEYAICRIVDRAAEKAAQAEKAAKAKAGKLVNKEQELNWAIDPHDLRTKMTQLKRFLSKGYQVKVTMQNLRKRSKRRATADEAKSVLQAVLDTAAEVSGTKETKARDGTVGDTLILVLHAPGGSAARAASVSTATEATTAL